MITEDRLYYGMACRACDHFDSTGKNLRLKSGNCYACVMKFPDGLFQHNFDSSLVHKKSKDVPKIEKEVLTPEQEAERKEVWRKKHIQAVLRWQKKNPEKRKKYQAKYEAKSERKLAVKRKYIYSKTEEQKEECRLKNNLRARTRYQNMSPEEKRIFLDKKKERDKETRANYTEERKQEIREYAREWQRQYKIKKLKELVDE